MSVIAFSELGFIQFIITISDCHQSLLIVRTSTNASLKCLLCLVEPLLSIKNISYTIPSVISVESKRTVYLLCICIKQ